MLNNLVLTLPYALPISASSSLEDQHGMSLPPKCRPGVAVTRMSWCPTRSAFGEGVPISAHRCVEDVMTEAGCWRAHEEDRSESYADEALVNLEEGAT